MTESALEKNVLFISAQYAFLVTASVQFAGGVIVFFGLLTSPKEVGEWKSCAISVPSWRADLQLPMEYYSF